MQSFNTRVFSILSLLLGWLVIAPVLAFDEGIEYQRLAQPQPTETGDKVEVLELFWYGCPHCFHLEPKIDTWLEKKPENVGFRRMPAVLGRSWGPHARAYYAADVLGVLDRIHEPLFEAIHVKKQRLFDEKALADFFQKQGVDRDEFLQAYRSFAVDMKVRRAVQMTRRYGIDGVPSVIVNGKYRTSPTLSNGSDKMFDVIEFLVQRESGSAPPADVGAQE